MILPMPTCPTTMCACQQLAALVDLSRAATPHDSAADTACRSMITSVIAAERLIGSTPEAIVRAVTIQADELVVLARCLRDNVHLVAGDDATVHPANT